MRKNDFIHHAYIALAAAAAKKEFDLISSFFEYADSDTELQDVADRKAEGVRRNFAISVSQMAQALAADIEDGGFTWDEEGGDGSGS